MDPSRAMKAQTMKDRGLEYVETMMTKPIKVECDDNGRCVLSSDGNRSVAESDMLSYLRTEFMGGSATMVVGLHDSIVNEFMGGSTAAIVDLHDSFDLSSMLTWVSRYVISCKGCIKFGNLYDFSVIMSYETFWHCCITDSRIGMRCNILSMVSIKMHADEHKRYGIRYGLHRIRFGREGVFKSDSHISQSYNMLCIDRMCMSAYTCIDIHNLMRMNAYSCTDINCMHSALIWLKCDKRLKAYVVSCL